MLVSLVRFQSSAPLPFDIQRSAGMMLKRFVGPALLAALFASACRNINVVTASYATLDEARLAGAVSGGYLPEGLPPSARDIREGHDPESHRHWALFSFSPDEADHLRRLIGAEEVSVDGQTCDIPGRIEWWPLVLRNQLEADRIHATGLATYRSTAGDLLFAVNWNQGRAYLWTAGG